MDEQAQNPKGRNGDNAETQWATYDRARERYERCQKDNRDYELAKYREALDGYLSVAGEGDHDRGTAEVFLRIGTMYLRGLGTAPQRPEAERWFQRAASLGLPAAQYSVAVLRSQDRDYVEVRRLLGLAASQQYAPAIYRLGVMNELGLAGPRDIDRAFECYEKAADLGHVLARRQVALAMLKGRRGLSRVLPGMLMLISGLYDTVRLYRADPADERIQA